MTPPTPAPEPTVKATKWIPPKTIYLFDFAGDPQGSEIVWCQDPDPEGDQRDVYEYKLVKKFKTNR